jgi:hypothetical protein
VGRSWERAVEVTIRRLPSLGNLEEAERWANEVSLALGCDIGSPREDAVSLDLPGVAPLAISADHVARARSELDRVVETARDRFVLQTLAVSPEGQETEQLLQVFVIALGCDVANLWRITEDGKYLRLEAHLGTESSPRLDMPLGAGIAGSVARSAAEHSVADFDSAKAMRGSSPEHPGFLTRNGIKAGHFFPLGSDQAVGVVAGYSRRKGHYSFGALLRARAVGARLARLYESRRRVSEQEQLEETIEDLRFAQRALGGQLQLVHEVGKWLAPLSSALLDKNPDYAGVANKISRYSLLLTEILRQSGDYGSFVERERGKSDLGHEVIRVFDEYKVRFRRDEVDVHLKVPKDPTIVRLSSRAAETILTNLIENSLYFIARDQKGDPKQISCELDRDDQFAVLRFFDNGPGFEEDLRSRLFSPFFSTKGDDGVGLGLANVRQLVEAAGGTVDAHSRWGYYAEFIVHIPIATPKKKKR